jgi:FlgD Ig-like domain
MLIRSLRILTTALVLLIACSSVYGQCQIGNWPQDPASMENATTSMKVFWPNVAFADYYQVGIREGNSGVFIDQGTVYGRTNLVINGLQPGKTYTFRVTAGRECDPNPDIFSPSPVGTGRTKPAKTIIRPDLCTSTGPNTLTFAWDLISCEIWYINVATDPGFVNVVGEYNRGVLWPNTSAIYHDFLPGTNYYYRMRAFYTHEGEYSGGSIAIPTRPENPVADDVLAADMTGNSFIAKWRANNGNATKYYFDVSPTDAFATRLAGYDNKELTAKSQAVTNLVPGSQYYFRVRASSFAGYTTPNSGKGVRLKPEINTPTNITTNSFDVTWVAAQNITDYRLDVSTDQNFGSYVAGYNSQQFGVTSTKVANLTPGSVYYSRMRTMLGNVPSQQSNVVKVLTTPVLNPITDISTTSFRVSWSQGSSAEGYLLDVATDEAFNNKLASYNGVTVVGATKDVADLTPGTKYYYRVRTKSGAEVSANAQGNIMTLPIAPTITITDFTPSSFVVNWAAITGADNYRLDLAYDEGFTQIVEGFNNLTVAAPFKAEGILAGTAFYGRLRAINTSGNSANSQVVFAKTRSVAPILKPATTVQTTAMTLTWDAIAGAETYRLDVATTADFQPGTFVNNFNDLEIAPVNVSYVVTGLAHGTQYYARLRVKNAGGLSDNSNTIAQSTFTLAPVWKDNFTSLADRITIEWNAVFGAESYELEVSANSSFTSLLPTHNPKVLDAANTSDVVSGLAPLTAYFFRIKARNNAGLSIVSLTKSASTVNADGTKPQIEMSFAPFEATAESGSSMQQQLALSATSSAGAVTVRFFHKKRSEPEFTMIPLSVDNGKFKVTTSKEWFDGFGMEFYFEVHDLLSQTKREPAGNGVHVITTSVESFTIPVARFGKETTNYVIISFPYVLSKSTLEDILVPVLGDYDRSAWRFVQYQDGDNKDYQNDGLRLRDVKQGEGYWFLTKEAVDLTFANGRAYPNSTTAPFVMKLRRGWNQVGNPFPYSVNWSDVLEDNNNPDAVGELHIFSGQSNKFPQSDELKVFGGGFVFADQNTDLVFKTTLDEFSAGRRADKNVLEFEQTADEWFVPITLTQGDVTNTEVGIGMSPKASDGKDRYDMVTLPRFGNFLEFNSRAKGFEFDMSSNVVGTSEQYQWNCYLETDRNSEVELTWNSDLVRNLGIGLLLWDESAHQIVNMAHVDAYRASGPAKFRVIFSKGPVNTDLPLARIGRPHPNPFTTTATIPVTYIVDENVAVNYSISDVTGRMVFTGTAISEEEGLFSVAWNGKTAEGSDAAKGLYFFKIKGMDANGRIIDYEGKLIKE